MELPAGAGQRDIEETPLLGPVGGRLRVRDRHEPALESGHEHGAELEPLRTMEGEELDGVVGGVAGVVVQRR